MKTLPVQSKPVAFASTKVPKFSGATSWDQYRQVFDAIVQSNGWDDATIALQLLSHLGGGGGCIECRPVSDRGKKGHSSLTCWSTNRTLRITGPDGGLSTPV